MILFGKKLLNCFYAMAQYTGSCVFFLILEIIRTFFRPMHNPLMFTEQTNLYLMNIETNFVLICENRVGGA